MRAYERFVNYAKVHTTSNDTSGTHPSFKGEFDLASQLKAELESLGLEKVKMDDKCYVYGYLPASPGYEAVKPLGFIAHMDTSEDAPGENVVPVFHENFNGEEVVFEKTGFVMRMDKYPDIAKMKGETLITSDGTTLLGADDKAGIAEIMTLLEVLTKADNGIESAKEGSCRAEAVPHGPIWVAFTPDEEIGEGTDFFDLDYFKASFAYTVDGGDVDALEYENFNAASLDVKIKGVSVHPGDAKDTMVNASKVAMEFHDMLPKDQCPECTEGREGFYHLTDMSGRVGEAELSYIIRDHDIDLFNKKKEFVYEIEKKLNEKYGEGTINITIKDSYFNMIEKIKPHMHLVDNALEAIKEAGLEAKSVPIRGGTDGAMLSYKGLPCPNLGTGGFFFHGKQECISIERMDKAVEILLNIVKKYSEYK